MSIAFPATLFAKIDDFSITLNENKAQHESLFTRKRQAVTLSGGTSDRWEGFLQTVSLDGDLLRAAWAFQVKVGLFGEFTIGDPDYTGPISGQSSILVNGAGQSGLALVCDAATPSVICLREGEYFQIGTEVKLMTADATADGAGNVTLNFNPALRSSPADNATVTLANPQFLFQLTSAPERRTDNDKSAPLILSFQEPL